MDDAVTAGRSRSGLWLAGGVATGAGAALIVVLVLAVVFGGDAPAAALGAPRFVDETSTAGIEHRYDGEFSFFVGGGVAVFDCDGDAKPDVYFAGGANAAGLYRNDSEVGGDLRFTRIPSQVTDLTEVTGAYPIDVDGDENTDLAVLRVGENAVLRGLGGCRFERANEAWNIDGGDEWTVAFSAQWEEGASLPTLAFGNYAELDEEGIRAVGCEDHAMLRPAGDAYDDPLVLAPGYCTLSILFSDWNGSGQRDLRMANDRHYYVDGEEQLWRVRPGEDPRPYSGDEGWQRMQIWGMGIATFDVNGDGLPEVFLTSQGDNKLQTLADDPSQPRYADIAFELGATAHRPYAGDTTLPSTAWHPEFQDVNNDGYVDLFITKGNVEGQPDYAAADPNNLLLGGSDGTFTEAAAEAGIVDMGRSRGAALADFNLDGMLDLVVVDRREPVKVWRNVGSGDAAAAQPMGNWIAVDLRQPGSNVHGIGAWVDVRSGDRVVRREVTIGGGHAGGQLGWIHFGIGSAESAEVRVVWPDGDAGPWMTVPADRFVTVERGIPAPIEWQPTGE